MISIIGGGITGLSTALALNKLGISCQVFEKSAELNEVGAGIWLQPNAMKVLDWLDIGEKIRKTGMMIDNVQITNDRLIPFRKSNPEYITDASGTRITAIHRARLQRVLYDSLPEGIVNLDSEYENHTVDMGKGKVIIHFNDSDSESESKLLLGADGINSKVRNHIFPSSPIRYSGQTCWRGISSIKMPEEFFASGNEAWGNGIRFGFSNISENEVYWFAVIKSLPNQRKDHTIDLKEKLISTFQSFHPLVSEIIENTSEEKILQNDINDLQRLPVWSFERICLIGDAAHATTPNMGQGACQGIEDAFYVSKSLSEFGDYSKAYMNFELSRRKKVDFIVNNSWRFGQMAHNPAGQIALKLIMKLTPEKTLINSMMKLYSVDIPEN